MSGYTLYMKRAKSTSWGDYFKNTQGRPVRPLLIKALDFVKNKGTALDLGSGALNESVFLLRDGFKKVIALDKVNVAAEIAKELPKDRFEYVITSFEDFKYPENYFDLINAQFALPFISPGSFDRVFKDIYNSLRPGGILTGQFFGDRDEWKNNSSMTFFSLKDSKKILSHFKILSFQEEEKDKTTAAGEMKHWHIFHFVVEK